MSKTNRFMLSVSQMHKTDKKTGFNNNLAGEYFILVLVLRSFHLRRILVLALVLGSLAFIQFSQLSQSKHLSNAANMVGLLVPAEFHLCL